MSSFFFDSSGLVKRYVVETGSTWVQSLTNPTGGHRIYLVDVSAAEVVAALVRRVPALSPPDLARVLADFKNDWSRQYQRLHLDDAIIDQAMGFAEKYRLRGYDSVQLAAAKEVSTLHLAAGMPTPTLISADLALNAAATTEGLVVDNPTFHP